MKVLIADDSPTIRALLSGALQRWGFDVIQCTDGDQAWAVLTGPEAPSLALVDWEMPIMDGIRVCEKVRAREAEGAPYTYLILLTARRDQEDVIAGMDAGADDYVVKPFDEAELRVRLRAGRRIIELQTELYRMQEMFRVQSRTDPLTGCLNRRAIIERLQAELHRAQRDGRPLAVGVLDIDHFKHVNDVHGHAAGDAVLAELTRRLTLGTRANDAYGRTGGEEFLVLWAGASPAEARVAAERVRSQIEGAPFATPGGQLRVTVSVGVTTSGGDEPVEAALARADAALYAAKAAGRNRVVLASAERPVAPVSHLTSRA
jgi:diguanylate cyclase (GGDEF)-like protein